MGGDHGPSELVPGVARAALTLTGEVRFLLHGEEAALMREIRRCPILVGRVDVRHADRVVAMDEKPAQALRRGKGTSMWEIGRASCRERV